MHGWMDTSMDGCIHGWMDGWMDGAQGNQLPQVGAAASPSPMCPSQLQGSLVEESPLKKDGSAAWLTLGLGCIVGVHPCLAPGLH